MASSNRQCRGRGRGVLGLTSYEPCPQPKNHNVSLSATETQNQMLQSRPVNIVKPLPINNQQNTSSANNIQNTSTPIDQRKQENYKTAGSNAINLLAKYNYISNPARPGGFAELTIKQGEKLTLLCKGHAETKNHLWREVKNENGETGFVPGTYCMVLEQTISSLPWLKNKHLEQECERKKAEKEVAKNQKEGIGFGGLTAPPPKVKQYQSAYGEVKPKNAAEAAKRFYCEICDKNLNGPQPYKMHMYSKAHREEMEYKGLS